MNQVIMTSYLFIHEQLKSSLEYQDKVNSEGASSESTTSPPEGWFARKI